MRYRDASFKPLLSTNSTSLAQLRVILIIHSYNNKLSKLQFGRILSLFVYISIRTNKSTKLSDDLPILISEAINCLTELLFVCEI